MTTLSLPVRRWLFVCAAAIFIMIVIGGITRLTGSGLSMTDWHPIHGVVPPLNEMQWQEEFGNYKLSPEYQKINKGMSLAAFKQIFFWEYIHRLWGRFIGIIFIVPLLWFVAKKQIPRKYTLPLFGLFVLGGLQGVIGWWMVYSGLIDRPEVSHYRLATHLSMAFLLYACCLWLAIKPRHSAPRKQRNQLFVILFLYIITAFIGAFVAGLKAGLIYNEFPFMGEGLVPSEMWFYQPWWQNFLVNEATIQFTHRWLAVITWLAVAYLVWKHRSKSALVLLGFVTLQVILGIATLLYNVPVSLGVLHQANAAIVLGCIVWNLRIGYSKLPA